MNYRIESTEKYILVSTSGAATVEELIEALDAIFSHKDWCPGFSYIFDHSNLSLEKLTTADVKKIAYLAKERRSNNAVSRSAIATCHDLEYGLSRMWMVYVADDADVETRVFRDMKDAIAWMSA